MASCGDQPKESFDKIYHSATPETLARHPESASVRSEEGFTLPYRAVCGNDLDKLQTFIDAGCDVNEMCDFRTPLFWSIHTFRLDAARMLVEAGCDVNIRCKDVITEERSSEEGDDRALTRRSSPLLLAVRQCQRGMVDLLLSSGSRIEERSILHEAIRTGNSYILQKLLEAGAPVDSEDHKGWTPLSTALIKEERDMVQMLLKRKPDVHKEIPFIVFQNSNKVYFSPLALASIFDTKMIPVLIAAGADPCRGSVPEGTSHSQYLKMCMAPICNSVGKDCTASLQYFLHENCPLVWDTGKHATSRDVESDDLFNPHDSVLFVALWKKAKGCINVILDCGFDIHCCSHPTKALVKSFIEGNKELEVSKRLQELSENPLPLFMICRNVIRKSIGLGISRKMDPIHLPPALKEYVLLSGLLEVSKHSDL